MARNDVVATVDDEGGLGDLLQVGVAVAGRLAPYAARGPVGPCGLGRPGQVRESLCLATVEQGRHHLPRCIGYNPAGLRWAKDL